MLNDGEASIDGRELEIEDGQTILDVARRLGIAIPTLCHAPGLRPEGACRICMVEVGSRGRLVAACHTNLQPGMQVQTDTPRLRELRRGVLSLILSEHEEGRLNNPAAESEMQRLMKSLDVQHSRFGHHPLREDEIDASHPYLRFAPSLCISCRRCLNACEQIQGQFVYGIMGRGAQTRLAIGANDQMLGSGCVACGACVDQCPTRALSDVDRAVTRTQPVQVTDSVCGYCGVGCRVRISADEQKVLHIDGVPDAKVNHGHLCIKGRYAHSHHHHADRLTTPLRRQNGELIPVSWERAIDWLARRTMKIRDEHGPDSLAAICSSRSTNEAVYLLQKLFRTQIGTNNVDCCARVCHASTALALQLVTGTGAATASFSDIESAAHIVLAGANPTEAHPVIGARIKQAVLRGARLTVIDPRRIELADYADNHLQLKPGTNVALFNAMAKVIIDRGLFDRSYLAQRTEGLDELIAFLHKLDLEEAAQTTGVASATIIAAAQAIGRNGPTLFVHGLGLSELTQGTASVMTLCNLGMLTGSIGRPGSGMLPLRGQNNVQGAADMGAMPTQITGYQAVTDPAVRQHAAAIWGQAPPLTPGKVISELLEAARHGDLKCLWIQGEDVAQSEPNQSHAIAALAKLDLLVVQDLFLAESCKHAHLVLPASGALEQEGTFTNGERRVQRVRPAVAPPGEARPDWSVVRDVAIAMGANWNYAAPAEVMDEISRIAPRLFGGISYDRLNGDGIQWPCPAADHPGTAIVHADGFVRGKGRLVAVDYVPSPEHASQHYPFILITGRVLEHYNVGTMTRRTANLALGPTDELQIHPEDAGLMGVADHDLLRIESRWGATQAPARLSPRIARGTLFLSFHDPEAHTNVLVGPHVDPQSKCPEYKVTAVRLTWATPPGGRR